MKTCSRNRGCNTQTGKKTGMQDTHKPNTIEPTSLPTQPKQTQNPKILNQTHKKYPFWINPDSTHMQMQSWRTIRWRPFTYLTSGSLNQGFLCEQDGGSGGAEEDIKSYQILGAKILSEKKKEAREKLFVSLVGWTNVLVH